CRSGRAATSRREHSQAAQTRRRIRMRFHVLGVLALASGCAGAPTAKTSPTSNADVGMGPASAQAQPTTSRDTELFRLPSDVRRTSESVALFVTPAEPQYQGTVDVELIFERPRADLYISARGLSLSRATLSPQGAAARELRVEVDDVRGAARL